MGVSLDGNSPDTLGALDRAGIELGIKLGFLLDAALGGEDIPALGLDDVRLVVGTKLVSALGMLLGASEDRKFVGS